MSDETEDFDNLKEHVAREIREFNARLDTKIVTWLLEHECFSCTIKPLGNYETIAFIAGEARPAQVYRFRVTAEVTINGKVVAASIGRPEFLNGTPGRKAFDSCIRQEIYNAWYDVDKDDLGGCDTSGVRDLMWKSGELTELGEQMIACAIKNTTFIDM